MCLKVYVILLVTVLTNASANAYDPDFEVPDEYLPNWDKYVEFLADMEAQIEKFTSKKAKTKENITEQLEEDKVNAAPETDKETPKSDEEINEIVKTTSIVNNEPEKAVNDGEIPVVDEEKPVVKVDGTNTNELSLIGDEKTPTDDENEEVISFGGLVNGKGTVSIGANFGCGSPYYSPYGLSWLSAFYQPAFYPEEYHDSKPVSNYYQYWPIPAQQDYWCNYWPISNYWSNYCPIQPKYTEDLKTGEKSGRIKFIDGNTGKEFDDEVVITVTVEGPKKDELMEDSGNLVFNGLVPASGNVRISRHF